MSPNLGSANVPSIRHLTKDIVTSVIDVCYIRQEYSGSEHLGVWSGCLDYENCIQFEAQNSARCTESLPSTCYFCNHAAKFNIFDVANTTWHFKNLALVTLSMDFTPGLADNTSVEYSNFVRNIQLDIQNRLFGKNGSFLVDFIDLREPRVTIAVKITTSTMWFIKRNNVKSLIASSLEGMRFNGKAVETVDILPYNAGFCGDDVITSGVYGSISWPQAPSGTVSAWPCPLRIPGDESYATRYCDTQGIWAATNYTRCTPTTDISKELGELSETDVTPENVANVSSAVNEVSLKWDNYKSVDVTLTVDVVEQILNTMTSSFEVIDATIDTINNVLFVGGTTLSRAQRDKGAASRLATVIDEFSNNVDVMSDEYKVVKDNVAMFVTNVDDVSMFGGRSMSLGNNRDGAFTNAGSSFSTSDSVPDSAHSGIVLDATLLDGLSQAEKRNVDHISLYALRDSKLYNSITKTNMTSEIVLPGNKTVLATRAINSNIIAASVPGVTINNLKEPVKIIFLHFDTGVNAECVYWDDLANDWSGDGCTVNASTPDVTVCHCDHLTNFALLMDVYGSGGKISAANLLALSLISYIGCAVSCLAALLTLLTYACFRRLKKDNPTKILMNLCSAIGLVNFVFIVGVHDYSVENNVGCKIVAVLLHYLLLSVMCWMLVEAFYMYLALIKVFNTHVAHFQLKSSVFGWGLPLIIVIATLAVDETDNYGIQPGGICWLERIPFYAAFMAPVCVTMIVNLVVFVLVLRQIFRRSSKKLTKSDSNRGTAVRVRGAISLIILLGLTWLFAILAIGDFGIVFHYLFAVTNTLQGLFIFVFYCVLKIEARNAWRMLIPCCKTPYEASKTTTATSKGYSETESPSRATASTDMTVGTTIKEVKQEPVKVEQDRKHSEPNANRVFRGNWQMNIHTPAGPRNSYDA